jgi:hypothetical protein
MVPKAVQRALEITLQVAILLSYKNNERSSNRDRCYSERKQ